ncbi:hypothetical protein LX99_04247 [Mucilaginibacter oryzae]|uniref:Concanavalin A-like lectin/glucanase superfamily protein n=1 Tax=Mucilaginibacter oryzae TaxID=468058 RepID=A0A316H1B3_9SPHI|nr:hypothetical protein [Mucilaginibacter oryzae]PWK72917.1 hypothetical protein LX99_04247 [Mucilaginibacter oryzae]
MPRYLPSLSTLISLDNLPDGLGFLQNAVVNIFDDVYFDHYKVVSSRFGEERKYNLDIILNKKIGVEIPGTGIALLLNPPSIEDDISQTSFNVTLSYRLGILRFINDFSLANFSFSTEDLIKLLLKISGVQPIDVFEAVTSYMKNPKNIDLGFITYSIEELITVFNSYYDLTGTIHELVYTEGTSFEEIESGLADAGISASDIINEFGISTDFPVGDDTIGDVYSRLNIEKDTTPFTIPEIIERLNTDFSLTGTQNEIIYVANPESSYSDIISALNQANLNLLDLIIKYVVDSSDSLNKIEGALIDLFALLRNHSSGIEFYGLFDPFVQASINDIALAFQFPRSVLNPINPGTNLPYEDLNVLSMLRFNVGNVGFSSTEGFEFNQESSFLFDKSEIGHTGFVLSFTDAKLDLSSTSNIPEASTAGYPVDFVGVYVKQAQLTFGRFGKDDPDHPSATLTADNLLIGTGGVSGTIKLQDNGRLHRKFGDFAVKLDTFELTFLQNAITNCDVQGELSFPKLKNSDGSIATIGIEVMFKDSGNFSITAKPTGELSKITWPDVFELNVRTLKLGEENGLFFFEVAGLLSFTAVSDLLGDFLPKNIEITKLRIWENGHLEFAGGIQRLDVSFTMKLGPIKLEVDHLTITPYKRTHNGEERSYLCVGFDGMLNTGRAGVGVGGNGIKYYFSIDDGPFDQFFSIEGIVIDMTIPGNVPKDKAAFILHGLLNVQQPTSEDSSAHTEYAGAVSFSMPKLHISGSAGMRLDPDIPSFLVDIGLELPAPIPIFAGLGIYGFRGLIGQHYIPSKKAAGLGDDATWWDYYKAPDPFSKKKGIQIGKFADTSGFSIGAGATIGTTFDDGFVFTSKLFIMLGLPDVFLLQGQAGVLRPRLNLDDEKDPPFSALIAIGDQSFMANLAVDYRIPDSGSIFSLNGQLDIAFFLNNASGWYINLGKDQPDNARIQAKILSILQGYAYLMISSQGIRAGAGAAFSARLNLGIVSGGIEAHLNLGGHLSFKPFQVGGFIEMGGSAYLKVLFVKLSMGLNVGLAVEAPHPVNIVGYFEVSVKIIFKRIRVRVELRLGPRSDDMGPLLQPIDIIGLPDAATGYSPAAAVHMLTGEVFQVNYVQGSGNTLPAPGDPAWKYAFTDNSEGTNPVTIPLDSYIDIEFLKPVKPGTIFGGYTSQLPDGFSELLPPQKGVNQQVTHEYALDNAEIFIWKAGPGGGQWLPYNIYEGVPAIVDSYEVTGGIALSELKPGYWQFSDPNKFNKVRLMSRDMFSYLGKIDETLPDMDALGFGRKDIFCYEHIMNRNLVDWTPVTAGTAYPAGQSVFHEGLSFLFSGLNADVQPAEGQTATSLRLRGHHGSLQITLPEKVSEIGLEFAGNEHRITVSFQTAFYFPFFFRNKFIPVTRDTVVLEPGTGRRTVSYTGEWPIDHVLITFDGRSASDYDGDLCIGGHVRLPETYGAATLNARQRDLETARSLTGLALYNKSLSPQEVIAAGTTAGRIGLWQLDTPNEAEALFGGWTTGSPDLVPQAWYRTSSDELQPLSPYRYTSANDAVIVPATPALKIENGSFSIEATVMFDPLEPGVCTLLSRISPDTGDSLRRGFALHLSHQGADPGTVYTADPDIPEYSLWLTCYNGTSDWGMEARGRYTIDCLTGTISRNQTKHLALVVDRSAGKVRIYLDRQLKAEQDIPAELAVYEPQEASTFLDNLSYLTPGLKARTDIMPPEAQFIEETQVLSNTLNNTIQPVWRPDSIFAVRLSVSDTVSYPGFAAQVHGSTRTFGFRTAGPLGHFQQHYRPYRQLEAEDCAGEFKLASLKPYIDFNRSSPDALGRYELSKPLYWKTPSIRLHFSEDAINAMFSGWNNYLGLPAIGTLLETTLIDPYQNVLQQSLSWEETTTEVTWANYQSLPLSQQLVFLFNQAAAGNDCNHLAAPLYKKLRQAVHVFPDLIPGKFYTAIFHSVYTTPEKGEQRFELHRFSFLTSRFGSFAEQVGSVLLDNTTSPPRYAVHPLEMAFSAQDIERRLKKLVDSDPDNGASDVLRYAVPFERIVFGGLGLKGLEPVEGTTVWPVINRLEGGPPRMLGLLVTGPEPFNDPKLSDADLEGTVSLAYTKTAGGLLDPLSLRYFLSRDTSSVFITNTAMDIPAGKANITFTARVFNGESYDQTPVSTGDIDLSAYLNS